MRLTGAYAPSTGGAVSQRGNDSTPNAVSTVQHQFTSAEHTAVALHAFITVFAIAVHALSEVRIQNAIVQHLAGNREIYVACAVLALGVFNHRRIRVYRWSIPLLIMTSYVGVILVAHGELLYGAMWILWWLYVTVLFPASRVLATPVTLLRYCQLVLAGLAGLLLWIYFVAEASGVETEWSGERVRFTGGLPNPTITSKIILTAYWLALLIWAQRRSARFLAVMGIALIALRATDVRADLVGTAVGTLLYFLSVKGMSALSWWSTAGSILGSAGALLAVEFSVLNEYSSGRLRLWRALFYRSFSSESMSVYMFGTGRGIIGKFHYDNLYLEVLLRYGLIGLACLIWALGAVLARTSAQARAASELKSRALAAWCYSVTFGICVSGLFGTVFPSLGNSLNIILLPLALAISSRLRSSVA